MARGEAVAPAPAPSHVDERGAVGIPQKWDYMLRDALAQVEASDAAEAAEAEAEKARGAADKAGVKQAADKAAAAAP